MSKRRRPVGPFIVEEDGKLITAKGRTILAGPRRRLLLQAASKQDFLQALESGMSNRDLAEMFGCNPSSDILALLWEYRDKDRWEEPASEASTAIAVPPEPVELMPYQESFEYEDGFQRLSDRLLDVTSQRLEAALDEKVKTAVAKALHEAAERIMG